MFKAIKTAHKLSSMGAKWVAATGVDPGDKGQLVSLATQYVSNLGLDPEDAWLTAMVNYINGMPHQDSKNMLAVAMLRFLDANEGKIPLSALCILGARGNAEQILGLDNDIDVPIGFDSRKAAGLAASTVDHILENEGVPTLLGGSLVLDKEFRVSFRTGKASRNASIKAVVTLGDLQAAQPFREFHSQDINDMSMYSIFVDKLIYEAMAALEYQLSETPLPNFGNDLLPATKDNSLNTSNLVSAKISSQASASKKPSDVDPVRTKFTSSLTAGSSNPPTITLDNQGIQCPECNSVSTIRYSGSPYCKNCRMYIFS